MSPALGAQLGACSGGRPCAHPPGARDGGHLPRTCWQRPDPGGKARPRLVRTGGRQKPGEAAWHRPPIRGWVTPRTERGAGVRHSSSPFFHPAPGEGSAGGRRWPAMVDAGPGPAGPLGAVAPAEGPPAGPQAVSELCGTVLSPGRSGPRDLPEDSAWWLVPLADVCQLWSRRKLKWTLE